MNAPLPPLQPAATASSSSTAPRPRTQQRKRNADDAPYAGPAPSSKRARAADTDGGPSRTAKRRRPSTSLYAGGVPALPALSSLFAGEPSADSMVDFTTLATPDLHEYLLRFDLVPSIFPSPLSVMDPPAPSMLLTDDGSHDEDEDEQDDPARVPAPPSPASSRTPTPPATPAARPRRLTDASATHRRRLSRASDADDTSSVGSKRRRSRARTPILADVGDVQAVLAAIAQRHFQDQHLAEGDAVSSFMAKIKRRPRTRSVDAY